MANFEVLPGLPPYGPSPYPFPASGYGAHREGFVVQFSDRVSGSWVGNFQPGLTSVCGAFAHPNGTHVLVVAGGDLYVVDPASAGKAEELGGSVVDVTVLRERNAVLFNENTDLTLVDEAGVRWRTKRLSWDGIRNLAISGDMVTGEGWKYDDTWQTFAVSIDTGAHSGGAYDGPEL